MICKLYFERYHAIPSTHLFWKLRIEDDNSRMPLRNVNILLIEIQR